MKKFIYTVFSILSIVSAPLLAQEDVQLHLDRNFYVLGDQVWIKAYLRSTTSDSQPAKQIHIECLSPEGEMVKHLSLEVSQKMATGDFVIPLDWEEGWYTLRVYTVWGPNPQIRNLTTLRLPIYDDFKVRKEGAYQNVEETGIVGQNLFEGNKLQLGIAEKIYQRREKITVQVNAPTISSESVKANVSVAILPTAAVRLIGENALQVSQEIFPLLSGNTNPESLGTQYGQIATNEKLENLVGVGVHMPIDNKIQWVYQNTEGVFSFENRLPGVQPIQVLGYYSDLEQHTRPVAVAPFWLTKTIPFTPNPVQALPFSIEMEAYLELNRKRKKYQEIFGGESLVKAEPSEEITSILQPEHVYTTVEFSNMVNLEEFLKEVIPYARTRSNKKELQVRVLSANKDYFLGGPSYLVDGWISYDQKAIFDIPIKEIEQVELFRTPRPLKQQFGILGKYGVFHFHTKDDYMLTSLKEQSNVLQINGLQVPTTFLPTPRAVNQPDFRPIIYWNPSIQLENGALNLEFQHSDDLGDFTIIIKGMDEKGELWYGEASYIVK